MSTAPCETVSARWRPLPVAAVTQVAPPVGDTRGRLAGHPTSSVAPAGMNSLACCWRRRGAIGGRRRRPIVERPAAVQVTAVIGGGRSGRPRASAVPAARPTLIPQSPPRADTG